MTAPVRQSPDPHRSDRLSQAHWDELVIGSAILPEIIAERGYRTLSADRVPDIFPEYQRRDCLFFPIYTVYEGAGTFQIKPDQPRLSNGTPVTYETLPGTPACIDVPARVLPHLRDPHTPLWITQGAKRVDSALSNGIDCVVGVQGVWGWRREHGIALPDWELISLNGRDVVIAFDSDCITGPQGREAVDELAAFLRRRGAAVSYCVMPALPGGQRCGLDEFFASGGTREELNAYLTGTLPSRPDTATLDLVRLDDIAAEPIEWLWRGWIPRRMLTLLGGYGGDGKSTVMAALTSTIKTGGRLPDGSIAPRINVLMLCAEDDPAYVVRPRLDLHGADPTRVFLLRGTRRSDGSGCWLDLRRDARIMHEVIADHEIGLVVIDPLSSYLPGVDRNSEGDIRDSLQPVLSLMEETGVAVVGIMHIGKSGAGRRAAQRLLGSTAFTALARSVIMVADLPDDQQPEDAWTGGKQKVLQVVKSNYEIPPAPQGFRRLMDAPITWQGPSSIRVEECFSAGAPKRGPYDQERQDATALLKEMLLHGPVAARDVVEQTKALGISNRTLRRAKKELNVQVKKIGYQGIWRWHLPPDAPADKGVLPERYSASHCGCGRQGRR